MEALIIRTHDEKNSESNDCTGRCGFNSLFIRNKAKQTALLAVIICHCNPHCDKQGTFTVLTQPCKHKHSAQCLIKLDFLSFYSACLSNNGFSRRHFQFSPQKASLYVGCWVNFLIWVSMTEAECPHLSNQPSSADGAHINKQSEEEKKLSIYTGDSFSDKCAGSAVSCTRLKYIYTYTYCSRQIKYMTQKVSSYTEKFSGKLLVVIITVSLRATKKNMYNRSECFLSLSFEFTR